MTQRILWASLFVAATTAWVGCSGSSVKPYPVSGQVTFRKKPLPDAVVTFHPAAGEPPGHPLSATTDAEGRFRLTTIVPNDGAPAGSYKVSIVFREKRADGDEVLRNGRNLLPAKYADPGMSGLIATVKPQDNVLDPFALGE